MTEQVTRRLDFGRKLLLGAALLGALAMPVVLGVIHTPRSRAAVPRQEASAASTDAPWELTSFKPTTVPAEKAGSQKKVFIKFGPDGLSGVNLTAHMLIQQAYAVQDNQIIGAPDWVNIDGYDFEARGNVAMPNRGKPEIRDAGAKMEMFQMLLSNKFKLAFHRETRPLPIYELVLDPGGSKLADAKPGDQFGIAIRDPQGNKMPSAFKVQPGEMTGLAVQTSDLAEALSQRLATNVLDNTGLKGKYDFQLKWTPDRSGLASDAPGDRENAGASLLDGLREQLGLQLKQEMTPMEVLVIDHIEKPAAN